MFAIICSIDGVPCDLAIVNTREEAHTLRQQLAGTPERRVWDRVDVRPTSTAAEMIELRDSELKAEE
jgi:hypothetical protein